MLEIAITTTSIIGLALIIKGLSRFGKMRECEKKVFETELSNRRASKSKEDYLDIKYISNI